MHSGHSTCIVVLAAGNSSRLGRPKQTLPIQQTTLLGQVVKTALETCLGPVVVVLGAHAAACEPHCASAHVVHNHQWSTGMAGSIVCGLKKALALKPDLSGVLVMVCDQPFVTHHHLTSLVQTQKVGPWAIVASDYGGTVGTPAFFSADVFSELLALRGEKGAKSILEKDASRLGKVYFPAGLIDIDTPEDAQRLVKKIEHAD